LTRKGRPPVRLRQLYRLVYLEGIEDRNLLASKLGISRELLRKYLYRLRRKIATASRNSKGSFYICPECFSSDVFEDEASGELVCRSCGLVIDWLPSFDDSLPFDQTYALESALSVGKSLGGTLPSRGLYRILAKSSSGTEDLGIRARQIRIITETNDPPDLAKLLREAYKLSRRFRLERDKLFNHSFGRNVRRAYWLVNSLALRVARYKIACSALIFTLEQHGKKRKLAEVKSQLPYDPTVYGLLSQLDKFLNSLKTRAEGSS